MPSASQNPYAMTFPADGTDLVFGAEQPASVHCFDCCLDSGVIVINRCTKSVLFLLKSSQHCSEIFDML
jgi:hypothetical protein